MGETTFPTLYAAGKTCQEMTTVLMRVKRLADLT